MDEYHQVWFDNLYMSDKFSLGLLNHPKQVMIEGVGRTSSHSNSNPPAGVHHKGEYQCCERKRQGLCVGGGTILVYVSARRVLDLRHKSSAILLDVLRQHHLAQED